MFGNLKSLISAKWSILFKHFVVLLFSFRWKDAQFQRRKFHFIQFIFKIQISTPLNWNQFVPMKIIFVIWEMFNVENHRAPWIPSGRFQSQYKVGAEQTQRMNSFQFRLCVFNIHKSREWFVRLIWNLKQLRLLYVSFCVLSIFGREQHEISSVFDAWTKLLHFNFHLRHSYRQPTMTMKFNVSIAFSFYFCLVEILFSSWYASNEYHTCISIIKLDFSFGSRQQSQFCSEYAMYGFFFLHQNTVPKWPFMIADV